MGELILTKTKKSGRLSPSILKSRRIMPCPAPVNIATIRPKELQIQTICRHPKSNIVRDSEKNAAAPTANTTSRDTRQRPLHHLGDPTSGRPVDIVLRYSVHYCCKCDKYFNVDTSDIAPPKSDYTNAVIDLAVRIVVDDGLPYRETSWHLWRDHRVFVPFATIQNWVEAAGEKKILAN
jgi:hypothetical protein